MPNVLAFFVFVIASIQQTTALPAAPPPGGDAPNRAREASGKAKVLRAPVLVRSVNPEFSEASRRRHLSGKVELALVVDENGHPQGVHVTKGVEQGLDEEIVRAVEQYRYKPATADGKPVATPLLCVVEFQTF